MRKILFRGKRSGLGDWIEGDISFFNSLDTALIYDEAANDWEVEPATVGQYTGLADINGNRIFEGDIVKTKLFGKQSADNRTNFNGYDVFVIIYGEGRYELDNDSRNFILAGNNGRYDCEVIGNIHDNPELIEQNIHHDARKTLKGISYERESKSSPESNGADTKRGS